MITCFFHVLLGSQAGYQARYKLLACYICCQFEFVFGSTMKSDNWLGNWIHNFHVQQATVCYTLTVKKKNSQISVSQKFSSYALARLMK